MIKLVALYKRPEDTEAFLKHYHEIHLPIVAKIPGLVKAEAGLVTKTLVPGATDYFLMAEMYFETPESFGAAMQSPENRAAGQDVQKFAAGLVSLHVVELE